MKSQPKHIRPHSRACMQARCMVHRVPIKRVNVHHMSSCHSSHVTHHVLQVTWIYAYGHTHVRTYLVCTSTLFVLQPCSVNYCCLPLVNHASHTPTGARPTGRHLHHVSPLRNRPVSLAFYYTILPTNKSQDHPPADSTFVSENNTHSLDACSIRSV
jgi:hypothetical protein